MTAEDTYVVTANRPHKATWERFYPEAPITETITPVDQATIPEFVRLRTYWDTYLASSNAGVLRAYSKEKTKNGIL